MEPVSADEVTSRALAAASGDPVAQAAFIRATQAEVWRLCAAMVDVGSADDLTQQTFLRAWTALPRFEARSSARTWLLGIARRVCADHLRGVVRQRRITERVVAYRATTVDQDSQSDLALRDLLARLPWERRSAFVLTQVMGLTYAEAAVVENVATGTIRSRVARARAELVTAWNDAVTV